jgi:hypothetical protein
MPVITTFGGMSARGFGLLSGGSLLPATSFITITTGTTTNVVPLGYNAIHIQAAVGGGGGAAGGVSYDKAGGESSGAGGGSGGYISDKIFTVIAGETLTFVAGSGGAPGNQTSNFGQPKIANPGTNTTLSGSTTGSIFTLTGGGGASGINGGVQGPLRTNIAGTAGSSTISGTSITSGQFKNTSNVVVSVTTNTSGPVGVFNQSGNGAVGQNNGNCGGDNCQIAGSNGAPSYAGVIAGGNGAGISGPAASPGTRGSGGGGGGAQNIGGGETAYQGGNGEIIYRFLQVKQ